MSKRGIDLSEWQTGLDYTRIAKEIDFAILREGYRQKKDKMFLTHLNAFRALQVPIPAIYHFIYATDTGKAREEAKTCIENLEAAGLGKDTMIFADLEYHSIDTAADAGINLSVKDVNGIVTAFVQTVKDAGYKPGIYSNHDFLKRYFYAATLEGLPLWLAQYSGTEPTRPCLFWQKSEKGTVGGHSPIDLDVWYDGEPDELTDGEDHADPVETAVKWMLDRADDPATGYDQAYRWGEKGDYDCSSAVISAWEAAGVPVKTKGATYTGNMRKAFLACGFQDVTDQVSLSTGKGLIRGDVLLNEVYHTAMYIGDGKEVEASINEKGTTTGGQPGDQTGREFLVRAYHNYPWGYVLRYPSCTGGACPVHLPDPVKAEEPTKAATATATTAYTVVLPLVRKGSVGKAVGLLQRELRVRGYTGLTGRALGVDDEFGDNTACAVKCFQGDEGLEVDGIVGRKTWAALLGV